MKGSPNRIVNQRKKKKKQETVGKMSWEAQQKSNEKLNAIDLQRAMHEGNTSEDSFENQVRLAVERGKKELPADFYVVVLFRKERLMKGVIRQMFFPRISCPTPEYDQIVYHYFLKSDKLELLWVVPNKQSTWDLPLMQKELPEDQQELVQFAKDFNTGKLDKLCERLNSPKEKTHDA